MTKEEAKEKLKSVEEIIQRYKNDIEDWVERAKRLQAIINKKDDWRDKLTQPDTSDYYRIDSDTHVGLKVSYTYRNKNNRKPEHAFRTQAQAELVKDKMLLMQEMHAFAHARNEGWIPDWADEEAKWGLAREFEHVISDYTFYHNEFVFGVSVKSEEIAQEMLEEFGERIEEIYNKQY